MSSQFDFLDGGNESQDTSACVMLRSTTQNGRLFPVYNELQSPFFVSLDTCFSHIACRPIPFTPSIPLRQIKSHNVTPNQIRLDPIRSHDSKFASDEITLDQNPIIYPISPPPPFPIPFSLGFTNPHKNERTILYCTELLQCHRPLPLWSRREFGQVLRSVAGRRRFPRQCGSYRCHVEKISP